MAKKKRRPQTAGNQVQAQAQVQGRPPGRPVPSREIQQEQAYEQPRKKKKIRHFYDYSLLFCIIFLTAFGLVMISWTTRETRRIS